MLAAQFGHLPMVKLLLDAGANPAAKDKRGNPLFVIAARAPDPSVLAWCYEQQRPSSGVLNRALFNAVGWNRIHNTKWLLQNGAELHPRDFVRGIVFHACRYASPEMLALLLENGADLNAPNKYGETPLIHAATYNRVDNMQFLFDHGVDLEETYNIQTKSMSLLAILRENLIPDKSEARAVVWKELGKLILRKFGDE